jgi:hypothetical protein
VPDFQVIAAVSETLQAFLTEALEPLVPAPNAITAQLDDLTTVPPTNPAILTIFLFEIGEDPSARNRPRVRDVEPTGEVKLTKPPMALLLRYLLTPFSGDRVTDHRILGRVIQVLYEESILSDPVLKGVLAGKNQALKITMAPLTLDERSRVWFAIQKPYRLSVSYEVRVVNLDTEQRTLVQPVRQRTADFATPETT